MCSRVVEKLSKFDTFYLLEFISFRDKQVVTQYKLNLADVEERMHSMSIHGGLRSGIDSVIQLLTRLPLLWVFVPFLIVSKWIGIGSRVYDYIASKRKIIPSNLCDEHCPIDQS